MPTPKNAKNKTPSKIKDLPAPRQELTGKEMKKVKGGSTPRSPSTSIPSIPSMPDVYDGSGSIQA
jgi:hypothetical protein